MIVIVFIVFVICWMWEVVGEWWVVVEDGDVMLILV